MNATSLCALVVAIVVAVPLAQERADTPREGEPEAVRSGRSFYQAQCASCHGIDAKGVLGPDLTVLWNAGLSDDRIFDTIRRGVPGAEMPASTASDSEIRATMAYLRSLAPTIPVDSSPGNVAAGEKIFWTSCGNCHRVNGRGGRLGPDLSRIGSSRPRAALVREIREPSAAIVPGYQGVTVVASDGRRIRGARKGEDAYSILIMDTRESLQSYLKANVQEVVAEKRSLMPDFGAERLSEGDLNDLLSYLGSLRAGR
jgi:putative heme-binding domain-containing protein